MTRLLFDDLFREPLAAPVSQGAAEGERRKREGMLRAELSHEAAVGLCREVAHDIAHGLIKHADGRKVADMLCSADDVCAWWERRNDAREKEGLPRVPWIANACGGLFEKQNWEAFETFKSVRPHANRNPLTRWRWRHD